MINLQQAISIVGKIAPQRDALDWDNVGLQVGEYGQDINNILVTLDINEKVIEEAVNKNIDLIVSHHPLIFKGLKNIHNRTANGRIILKAIKNNIAIYSAHTNMDIANSGLNDYLAKKLGIVDTELLSNEQEYKYYKLIVYVPKENVEEIREELFNKGAGNIGDYSNTSFNTNGIGTFMPGENSNPYIGEKGKLEKVDEIKIETIVPEQKINNVLKGLFNKHPYEEVAYDLYSLPLQSKYKGIGRIGYLKEPITLREYSKKIKKVLNIENLKVRGNLESNIHKVAICSGAGADYISLASSKGADLFITGDVKFHEAQMAEDYGINLIDAHHYNTEIIFIELLADYLKKVKEKEGFDIEIFKSKINSNPWINI